MTPLSPRDYDGLREAMLKLGRERLPEWTDQQPGDMGVLLVELMAWMGDQLFYHQDRIADESFLSTAAERRSVMDLLALLGQRLRPPQPASARLTLKVGSNGATLVHGVVFEATAPDRRVVPFRYVGETVQLRSGTRSIEVLQVDAVVEDEAAGSGDGGPWQSFPLLRGPLQEDTLRVMVDGAPWRIVQHLLDSGPTDAHVLVLRDASDGARLQFGDGVTGAAPPRGHDNVRVWYRTGGGAHGNVPAGCTWRLELDPPSEISAITQPSAATGGADAESLPEAARRGPALYRSMGRAVTSADLVAHALANGAGQAVVVPRGWGRIDVIVLPPDGGDPSDMLCEVLRERLTAVAMVGVQISVKGPQRVPFELELTLEAEVWAVAEQVEAAARAALTTMFDPSRLAMGAALHLSKVYEAMEAIRGVASVYVSRFNHADRAKAIAEGGRIAIARGEAPVPLKLDPKVEGGIHA